MLVNVSGGQTGGTHHRRYGTRGEGRRACEGGRSSEREWCDWLIGCDDGILEGGGYSTSLPHEIRVYTRESNVIDKPRPRL